MSQRYLRSIRLIAIFTISSLLFLVVSKLQGKNDKAEKEAQHSKQQTPAQIPSIGSSSNRPAQPNTSKTENQDNQTSPDRVYRVQVLEDFKDSHFFIPLLVNAVIAAIGLGTLAIVWRQANSNQISAEAAKQSAEALIESQRAWILVLPDHFENPKPMYGPEMKDDLMKFFISIKNVGTSPARLISTAFRYCLLNDLDELSPKPEYPQPLPYNGWIVAPQELVNEVIPLEMEGLTAVELDSHCLNKTKFLFAYGVVKYRDIFNRERETRIGYVYEYFWVHQAMKPSRRIKQAGPPEYNHSV